MIHDLIHSFLILAEFNPTAAVLILSLVVIVVAAGFHAAFFEVE